MPLEGTLGTLLSIAEVDSSLLTDEEAQQIEWNQPAQDDGHNANLADVLDESYLNQLAADVIDDFDEDEAGRQEWLYRERDGLRLLGVSSEIVPGADFEGASEVTYPGLIEAVIQFQARALAELWPADGPAKTIILGDMTPDKEEQGQRVEGFLNFLCTEKIPGAFEETDRMLFRLPLSGSAFVKLAYDPLSDQIIKRFFPSDDFVVPYEASDLRTAPRYTCILRYSQNDLKRLFAKDFYKEPDFMVKPGDETSQTNQTLRDAVDKIDGTDSTGSRADDGRHVVLEQMCYLDLPGFEHTDKGKPTGIGLPYIVSVEKESQKVLSVRRNWREGDDEQIARVNTIHYRFLPGFGFYGIGLYHVLGHIVRGETGSLRALLDAAAFSNMQGGYRSRDARIDKDNIPIAPGEFRQVQATAEELSKAFFTLPYKEPSKTLFELLQWLDEVTRRVAGTTEVAVGDASNNAPVGTTLALIEQSQRVQTGIHLRLHNGQKQELKLLHDLCYEVLPPEYPYDVEGESRVVKQSDFDGRVDVAPVSDPNVVSSTQRIATAQAQLELATQSPDLYDMRKVHERVLQAMRVPHHEEILPDEAESPRMGPVEENMAIMMTRPVQAHLDQDHQAHIVVHQTWFEQLPETDRNRLEAAYMAHAAEHAALQYQLQMMRLMGLDQLPEAQSPQDEALIAQMAAQAAQLMQQPLPPDREAVESQAAIQRRDASALADIRRKESETNAKIARDDALAIASMQRDVAKDEERLVRQSLSDETLEAAEAPVL